MTVLQDLVEAVLEWEEADQHRAKILDSKSAKKSDVDAANLRLMNSIRKLRAIARTLRKIKASAPKRPKKPFNWGRALDVAAGVLDIAKRAKDGVNEPRMIDAKVIDMK